ncbi:LOW QUALITY PROTEIN: prefoldin subunit 6 [Passer domesticus]|uniref:LOW QUALITY PROTEIN: prefoldin subunit 6 n=1 Tax=Passer domesticus TaxID=48849 RepID=UPI0030FEECF7
MSPCCRALGQQLALAPGVPRRAQHEDGAGGGARPGGPARSRPSPPMAEPLQKKLQGELEKYQQLQKELGRAVAARQKLETQLTENNIVQEELNLLDESNTIFKLLGPVLVKQDLEEAKGTVGKRLEYISGEMKRYEQQMQELERRSEQQRELLGRLQQELQAKP